jgi:uncharacterized membrane protein (UPF0127 family)
MGECLRAINRTRKTILCERLEDAGGLGGQSRGLLGRKDLDAGDGMLFVNGRINPFMWMHMMFMKFAIDIVFLDRNDRVIKINHELKPWRFSSIVFGARKALELSSGAAARSGTAAGDTIEFE